MSGLKPPRALPQDLLEWSKWCTDQSIHDDDNSTFTGVVTGSNIVRGSGSPENIVAGSPGDMYFNTLGGTSTTLYLKETGTGKVGWVAK